MAIHDAIVEVTCDGCGESIEIQPDFTSPNYSGNGGSYEAIEEELVAEDWVVADGKHYCTPECAAKAKPDTQKEGK